MGFYTKRELSDQDWKTQLAKGYSNIPKGERIEIIDGYVSNLYGSFARVKWNGHVYDVNVRDLEFIKE